MKEIMQNLIDRCLIKDFTVTFFDEDPFQVSVKNSYAKNSTSLFQIKKTCNLLHVKDYKENDEIHDYLLTYLEDVAKKSGLDAIFIEKEGHGWYSVRTEKRYGGHGFIKMGSNSEWVNLYEKKGWFRAINKGVLQHWLELRRLLNAYFEKTTFNATFQLSKRNPPFEPLSFYFFGKNREINFRYAKRTMFLSYGDLEIGIAHAKEFDEKMDLLFEKIKTEDRISFLFDPPNTFFRKMVYSKENAIFLENIHKRLIQSYDWETIEIYFATASSSIPKHSIIAGISTIKLLDIWFVFDQKRQELESFDDSSEALSLLEEWTIRSIKEDIQNIKTTL
jgi:hypothetical protein